MTASDARREGNANRVPVCRDDRRGLPLSGVKAVLKERLLAEVLRGEQAAHGGGVEEVAVTAQAAAQRTDTTGRNFYSLGL